MLVNKKILEEIYYDADEEKISKVHELLKNENIKIIKATYEDEENFELHAKTDDPNDIYVKVQKNELVDYRCTCKEFKETNCLCHHIIAAVDSFNNNKEYLSAFSKESVEQESKIYNKANQYKIFNQILNSFYNGLYAKDDDVNTSKNTSEQIDLKAKLICNTVNKEIHIEFKLYQGKFNYKIRDLVQFYENFMDGEVHKYGNKIEFKHIRENMNSDCYKLLDFALKYSEIIKYANEATGQQRYLGKVMRESEILLSNTGIDEIFNVYDGNYAKLKVDNKYERLLTLFSSEEPEIKFLLEEYDDENFKLYPNIDIYNYYVISGKEYDYIYVNKEVHRCTKQYKDTVIKLLNLFKNNFTNEIIFKKSDLPKFYSLVVPNIEKYFEVKDIKEEELEKYIPQELYVKVFLDVIEKGYITADIKFGYKDFEFNPLINDNSIKISRDVVKESKALEVFVNTGFMLDQQNSRLILADDEKIYNFLSEEIVFYMKNFEILVTDAFKKKEIKHPKITNMGIKVENNLLKLDFKELNFSMLEIVEIMEYYKLRKKFYKLNDGTFLDLQENETLEFLEKLNIDENFDYKQLESGELELPVYRTLYLDKILKNSNINSNKNAEFRNFVNNIQNSEEENIETPNGLKATLRRYQQTGYKWLKNLDNYGLGGILADDMGLGKTLQVITLILDYNEKNQNPKTTLVVCPSSLSLNWYNEINKFAPSLKALVISGNAEERKKKINNLEDYNVIITSYDLLKRDVEEYKQKDYEFKYIIADEAQYIKNNNTQNFKAIKEIKAETRFALTGTPIENSLAELWSIFDFSMPGYLYGYKHFKETFETPIIREEDLYKTKKLKMLIEPFILRRIKEEVLTELPEKTVTVLNSEMEDEQHKIYMTYMAEAREEVENELIANGFEKNQMKILALLMRLRQICCHPSLFLENYEAGSGKLNQCLEIIKDAVEGNHKILLFSGYTSMFDLIEPELEKEGIRFFKLTGQTKVNERIQLVDEFNENPDIKVFLISLKAGGTGLNLIGADMVIHYDPWWNISAENQATDRTYRIGQKRNVQVYKLITKNSIEEKIYELQQRKAKLVDNMLSTNETFINKLTKDEIMELFK